MTFQIHALPAQDFAPLFDLSDRELVAHRARRVTVDACPGSPCRVTLTDTPVGETVLLLNHTHLDTASPVHSSHAIFVRQGQPQAQPAPGEVPEAFRSRQMSLRAIDDEGMMIDAIALPGTDIANGIAALFQNPDAVEVHIHFAGPGCFGARATRV